MSIGSGIFLIAVGAILAFALNVTVDWIDLALVGYILMAAGVLVTILGLVLLARRRRSVSHSRTVATPGGEQRRMTTTESDNQLP